MGKQLLAAAVALLAALLLSGCIQTGKGFSDLKLVLEKNNLNGTLAPGTMQELLDFEKDLLSLNAIAKTQSGSEATALIAMVDLRLAIVKMQQNILNSAEEASFIDYYNLGCASETSLKKTISYLDKALTQADLAIALANNFSESQKEFGKATNPDVLEIGQQITALKPMLFDKKNKYEAFCD